MTGLMQSISQSIKNSRLLSSAILGGCLLIICGIAGVADTGTVTYNGCENVATGVMRLLPNRLPAPFNECILAGNPILLRLPGLLEVAVSWNQVGPQGPQGPKGDTGPAGTQGPQGIPGTGATVTLVASGDPTCAAGGAKVTDGSGNTAYVCNGQAGTRGPEGPPGTGAVVLAEPAGANCVTGGAKVTDGSGNISYICNGAKGDPGPVVASISSLSGIACTTSGNQPGTVSVNTGTDNTITLSCVAAATSCVHSDGLGQFYQDCNNPPGTPGNASTYNLVMANEAEFAYASTISGCTVGLICGQVGVKCDNGVTGGDAVDLVIDVGASIVWQYAGALAGRVHQQGSKTPACPTSGDPTWN